MLETGRDLQTTNETDLSFEDWGIVEYKIALARMIQYTKEIANSGEVGRLVFCQHPSVVTTGRATQPGDVFGWDGPIEPISRGGRATYHGPSQLMVYPLVNLKHERRGRRAQEVVGYLRELENAIVETLGEYGVQAVGKSVQSRSVDIAASDETGVWVMSRKIASLGVAVKNWVTFHGAAVNLDYDPKAFSGINPCGFKSNVMVSLEQCLEKKIDREDFADRLKRSLLRRL